MTLCVNKLTAAIGLSMAISFSITAEAATCKQYSNCAEAVENWCAGNHSRADRDNDGIPCENVCSTNKQVDKIKNKIGCDK